MGDGDVRMVYDATKSGLNGQLWAPCFMLPTVESHLLSVQPGSFMGDIDLSEMFLNFILHKRVRPFAGVDLTPYFPEELASLKRLLWEHWTHCGMGIIFSPYTSIQGTAFAEEIIRGDPNNQSNIVQWTEVVLNLPGSLLYKPCDPWVYKARLDSSSRLLRIANNFEIYLDPGLAPSFIHLRQPCSSPFLKKDG
jgi:hypothetical protein